MSQNAMLLAHFQGGRVIDPLRAWKTYGVYRLAARVSELWAQGHPIGSRLVKTRSGRRVALYFMQPKER